MPKKGFAVIIILVVTLLALVTGGYFLLKSQGKLSLSNQVGTNQSLNPSNKAAVPDFATAMKELGCSDPASCMSICSRPENADKCNRLMQAMNGSGSNLDQNNLPKIIQADFIDLDRITRISKFRSGSGHDYSGGDETCRSMKHYFYTSFPPSFDPRAYTPKQPYINIYSPVDGDVISIDPEQTPIGKQIRIRSPRQPDLTFVLFHVYPVDGLNSGNKVRAGDIIGTIGSDGATDIAVQAGRFRGKLFSYFDVMPDEIFQRYQKRGINTRGDVIISRQYRDQHPFTCTGEQFNQRGDPSDSVTLKPI